MTLPNRLELFKLAKSVAAEDVVVLPSWEAKVSSIFEFKAEEPAGYGSVLLPGDGTACEEVEVTSSGRAVPIPPPRDEEASTVVVAETVSVADTTLVSATVTGPVEVEEREPLPARLSSPRGAEEAVVVVLPRQEVVELVPGRLKDKIYYGVFL